MKPGATVIDVGMNRVTDPAVAAQLFPAGHPLASFHAKGSVLVGDVHPAVVEVAGALTPVPGGVGPLTITMLMMNTLRGAGARGGGPTCALAARAFRRPGASCFRAFRRSRSRSPRDLSLGRELRIDALPGLKLVQSVTRHHAAKLLVRAAGRRDDDIEVSLPARFVKQRNDGDGDVVCATHRVEPRVDGGLDGRMNDLLQVVPRGFVREHDRPQLPAVERTIGAEDAGSNRSRIAARAGVPAATTSRATTSASMVGTPSRSSSARTTLFSGDAAGEPDTFHVNPATRLRNPFIPRLPPPPNLWPATCRSSTKVFHSWHCGHCHSNSVLL